MGGGGGGGTGHTPPSDARWANALNNSRFTSHRNVEIVLIFYLLPEHPIYTSNVHTEHFCPIFAPFPALQYSSGRETPCFGRECHVSCECLTGDIKGSLSLSRTLTLSDQPPA